MWSQCPPSASSTELSMISHRQCIRPRLSVDPMYMPGRLRTASSPSRTEQVPRGVAGAVALPGPLRGTDVAAVKFAPPWVDG